MKPKSFPLVLAAACLAASIGYGAGQAVPPAAAQAAAIPHPVALAAAAVEQKQISDPGREALVLGNGDLNALLWEKNGALRLRVTKNDIWDARINTADDPPLLRMNIRERQWAGGAGAPASWHQYPYPQPRCAAEVVIGRPSRTGAWEPVRAEGTRNCWRLEKETGVMEIAGARGASAGYRWALDSAASASLVCFKLRLSGAANASYYASVVDAAGRDLVRSGWQDAPTEERELAFPLPAGRAPAALELYVMTRDGRLAGVRYRRIAFEDGQGLPTGLALGAAQDSVTSARLDLRRALAEVVGAAGRRTSVRTLADRNVLLIQSPEPVALEEVRAPQLPPARRGETGGVAWLHLRMPGDLDYPGMEYALAIAARGELKAAAVATSFDTREGVLESALRLARQAVAEGAASLVARHEQVWADFWSASGVELGDRFFQDAWYRNLYYMRCFCRPGTAMPITLYAGLATDQTGWHGAPTLDYNLQQTFWPMLICNHPDLMDPYRQYLADFAPRGRWLAKATYGLEGLFYPVNIFGPEHLVAPGAARSRNARQIAYVPWSYGLGLTGWALQNLWWQYRYQPSPQRLESIYPLLRDGAEFYANVLEQCRDGADGQAEIGPSFNPEHGPFGTFNNPVDLCYFRFLLGAAAEAARRLDRDAALAGRWLRQRSRVPDYETTPLGGQPIVANWKGADAQSVPEHNVAVPIVPIFPGDEITWFSPPERRQLFERTLRWLRHNGNNSHIMVNVARARFSLPEAYTETRAHFSKIATPNGLYASWPGHGYYLAESWAFAGLAAELLLQSVGDIIRVFPAWPQDQDARFTRLRAQGGFLVSAELRKGEVARLEITSTAGGPARLLSPWPGVKINGRPAAPDPRGVVEWPTRPGEQFVLAP
jgi:hypothetical protein